MKAIALAITLFLVCLSGYAQFEQPAYYPNNWTTNGPVNAMVKNGNTLYLGGDFNYVGPYTGYGMVAPTSTGVPVVTADKINGKVLASVSDGNGGWFIGGEFTQIGSYPRNRLAHILSNNTLDIFWNPDCGGTVKALVLSGTSLYVGGTFNTIGGVTRTDLAQVHTQTGSVLSLNITISGNSSRMVNALALSGTTLVVGGYFNTIGGVSKASIAAIDLTNQTVLSWNNYGSNNVVNSILINGTTIYAGGDFSQIGGENRTRLAALNLTTGQASTWNPGADDEVFTLALNGTTLYAGGEFSSIGGQSRGGLGAVSTTTGQATTWNPNAGWTYALHLSGTTLYAGGIFPFVGTELRQNLAAFNTTNGSLLSFQRQVNYPVRTICISGSNIFAGGEFTSCTGVYRNRLAAIDLTNGQATSWDPKINNGVVNTMVLYGNNLYLGGSFQQINNQSRLYLGAVDASTAALTSWNPSADGVANSFAIRNNILYVGGQFYNLGGQARKSLASFDLSTGNITTWNPTVYAYDPNQAGPVNKLHIDGSTLYVGGRFTSVAGQSRNHIASFDLNSHNLNAWNPNSDNEIFSFATSGSNVYVGGFFTSIGGQSRSYIAALNSSTGLATSWNPGSNDIPFALATNGTVLYAGGDFTQISGQNQQYLACLNTSNGALTNWTPVVRKNSFFTWRIRDLQLIGSSIYVAGYYLGIGKNNQANHNILSLTSCPEIPTVTAESATTFCTGGSVTLTASTANAYLWSNGATTQSITVSNAGTYTVRAIANTCTSQTSDPIVVTVNSIPNAPTISAGGPTTFCAGGNVVLTASAADSYLWSTGETTQSITVTNSGNYTVQGIVNRCTSATSDPFTVNVTALPATPTITASGATNNVCFGNSVTLFAPVSDGYIWSNGATTQSIVVSTNGSFTVRVIANGCTSAVSAARSVSILNPPTLTASALSTTTFCSGGSVTLTCSVAAGYLWSNGATTRNIVVTTSGTYSVKARVLGCLGASSNAITVTVNTPPNPDITPSGPTTICAGNTVTLTAPTASGYLWSTNETTQSIVVSTAGSYTLRTILAGCTSAVSPATTIAVNPVPGQPTITANGPTTFTTGGSVQLSAPAGYDYIWSTNETTQDIVVSTSGTYTVKTISNGCTSDVSLPVTVTVTPPLNTVFIWNGTGNYNTASFWSGNQVPSGTIDSIIINSGTCTYSGDLSLSKIRVEPGATLIITGNLTSDHLNVAGNIQADKLDLGTGPVSILGGGLVSCSTYVKPAGATTSISNTRLTANILNLGSEISLLGASAHLKIAYNFNGFHGIDYLTNGVITQQTPNQYSIEAYFDPASTLVNGGAWFNVGPPIQNYPVNDLSINNTFAVSTYDNSVATASSLYLYDPNDVTWPTNQGYIKAPNASYQLAPNEGVRVWLRTTKLNGGAIEFSGLPFFTDQLFNLAYCNTGCSHVNPNGFNLVKNPFSAILDWTSADIVKTDVDEAFWVWRSAVEQFSSYSGGIGINGGREIVAIGQAFFIKATAPGASLFLPKSATTTDATANPFRSRPIDNLIRLQVKSQNSLVDEAAVRFHNGSTTGYDGQFDAYDMAGPKTNIATLLPDGTPMGISVLPLQSQVRIPVTLARTTSGQQLQINLENFDPGIQLYLNHPSFGSPMPVQNGFSLSIAPNLNSGLELIATPSVTTLVSSLNPVLTLSPNPAHTHVQLHLAGATIQHTAVQDQLGRVVHETNQLQNGLLDIRHLPAGAYTVAVVTDKGTINQRLVIVK